MPRRRTSPQLGRRPRLPRLSSEPLGGQTSRSARETVSSSVPAESAGPVGAASPRAGRATFASCSGPTTVARFTRGLPNRGRWPTPVSARLRTPTTSTSSTPNSPSVSPISPWPSYVIRSCVSSRERSIGIQTPGTATRRAGSASRTSTVESTPSASSRPSRRTSSAAGSWTPPLAAGYSERWLGNGSSPRCTDRRPSSTSTPTSGTMSCLTLATAPSRRSAPARSKPGSRTGLRCWHRPR